MMHRQSQNASCNVPRRPGSGYRRRGSVLIVVMWMALGLITIALVFCQSMLFEYGASRNYLSGAEAGHAIEGMRRYLAAVLDNLDTSGTMPELDVDEYEAEAVPIGEAICWLVGRDANNEDSLNEPAWGLIDEAAKINLNTATLDMLEAVPGMPVKLAAAIIDWRDGDDELTPGGAETQTYLALDPAYLCKNSAFETVEELRLVLGADWDLLYGEDLNMNGVLDPNENDGDLSLPNDNANGLLEPGLLEYVTVWSLEKNTRDDGSARINITQADSIQSLGQLLRDELGASKASQVMGRIAGSLPAMNSIMEFYIRSGLSAEDFAKIEDALSVSSESTIAGRINVNHAPAEVLACLPEIDSATAAKMATYRMDKTEADLNSIAWVAEVLEDEQANRIGPYITVRGNRYRADIAAVGKHGHGLRRSMMILDTTGDAAKVIYRRDGSRLGWPLGATVRNELEMLNEE